MAVTANERKRQERERKRAAGLIKIEIWLLPDQAKKVRDYAKGLKRAKETMTPLDGVIV